jgi:hypothetical protein
MLAVLIGMVSQAFSIVSYKEFSTSSQETLKLIFIKSATPSNFSINYASSSFLSKILKTNS